MNDKLFFNPACITRRNVCCFRIIYVYRYIVHIIQCTAVVGKPTENYVTLVSTYTLFNVS